VKPRPYQQEAIDAVFDWWTVQKRHGENPCIVLPTASGKTVIFCLLIKRLIADYPGTKILILAHRKELVSQAEDKLLSIWSDAPVGVYAASLGRREVGTITIASRDTIVNHLDDLGKIDLILVDEAHHIAPEAESRYRKIVDTLTVENPHLHVLGFTATPYRKAQGYIYGNSDKHLFQGVAYEAKMLDLIKQGYLTRITAKSVNSEAIADLTGVKTTGGDFNIKGLESVVAKLNIINACVSEWERLASDRKATVFFCVTVLHAMMVSEELSTKGYDCPVITGDTPKDERQQILDDFQAGKYIGLVNVVILTEGWDCPVLDCICLMRPTKSLSLYIQIVGRGLRLYPGKENTLLLDFGGCLERFGPIDRARPAEKKGTGAAIMKECPECKAFIYAGFVHCPECGHLFDSGIICEKCQQLNDARAVHCFECNHLLRKIEDKASTKAVLSDEIEPDIVKVEVSEIKAFTQKSKTSGREYLTISFSDGVFQTYYKRLMIGYPGYAGLKAAKEWMALTRENIALPETPNEAVSWINEAPQGTILKPVTAIEVDMSSKWRDIVRFNINGAATV